MIASACITICECFEAHKPYLRLFPTKSNLKQLETTWIHALQCEPLKLQFYNLAHKFHDLSASYGSNFIHRSSKLREIQAGHQSTKKCVVCEPLKMVFVRSMRERMSVLYVYSGESMNL